MKKSALGACFIWISATLFWWAFAFAPMPDAPPDWLLAARYACFGRAEDGLPEAFGWFNLVLSPLTLLIAIFFVWSLREIKDSWSTVVRYPVGRVLVGALLLLFVGEAFWVTKRILVAQDVEAVRFDARETDEHMPDNYPRTAQPLPEFRLVDQTGLEVTDKTFLGRPVVLTFAFAHCATVCPVLVAQILSGVPADLDAEILIVTLDPWRDTPGALPGLAKKWKLPSYAHVLSSTKIEHVTALFDKFNVPVDRDEKTGNILHPALVFVADSQGKWNYTFNNPSPKWLTEAVGRVSVNHAKN